MNWLNNFTVRSKIIGAFALVLIVTIGLGAFSLQRLGTVNAGATEIAENWLVATHALGNFGTATMRYRQVQGSVALAPTPELAARETTHLEKDVVPAVQAALAEYEPTINPGEERALFDRVMPLWTGLCRGERQISRVDQD